MEIFNEIKKVNIALAEQQAIYHQVQDEYLKVLADTKTKVRELKQRMKNAEEQARTYLERIADLKEMWARFSYFPKESNIGKVLTKLIRTIKNDNDIEIVINEDISFYDSEQNWLYTTNYYYIREFIDLVIETRIKENKREVDELFLNGILDEFLNNHQNLIKTSPVQNKHDNTDSQQFFSPLFRNLMSIYAEKERLQAELSKYPLHARDCAEYQMKKLELKDINDDIASYSCIPRSALILILQLMEKEEFAYKTFKAKNDESSAFAKCRKGAICRVNNFNVAGNIQTKYTTILEDEDNIIDNPEIKENYPYLIEFVKLFVNAQYTACKLGWFVSDESWWNKYRKIILNMTIEQFKLIHMPKINANFKSNLSANKQESHTPDQDSRSKSTIPAEKDNLAIPELSKENNSITETKENYSYFPKSSNIGKVLTRLIRTIENDSNIESGISEDISFYDDDNNWIYETAYPYIKEFIDLVIKVRIKENKREVDELFLYVILDEFLDNNQNLIKKVVPPSESEESNSEEFTLITPEIIFKNLMSVYEARERISKNASKTHKIDELIRIDNYITAEEQFLNKSPKALIFILQLMEGEEYVFKRIKNQGQFICKVERFLCGTQVQMKYTPVINLGTDFIHDSEIMIRYPYLIEFIKMYVNAQYTAKELLNWSRPKRIIGRKDSLRKLTVVEKEVLTMTIQHFMNIHQDIINKNFSPPESEEFNRK